VLAVADVVEAMISHRPYRPALPVEAAISEIEEGAGRRYAAAVSGACLELLRAEGFALTPA
jgi:HD-GYP domain-containing protein (c-di-GMP phosphodiesterase class II)